MYELAIVLEELAAAGCGLLMMVVSPAICGTIIARFGTDAQKQHWLPKIASGSSIMAFGITEPDAGSNSHKLTTVATRDGDTWVLNGRKIYISGVDEAEAVLIVGKDRRRQDRQAAAGPVRRADRHARLHLRADRHGHRHAGEAVPALPGRRDPAGHGADRGRGRRAHAAVCRAEPGADHGLGDGHRQRPVRPGQGRRVRQGADRLERADRRASGPRAPAGPGQDRAGAGQADDAEGSGALRRGR